MAPKRDSNQACIWIAAGCGGAMLVVTIAIVLAGYFTVQKARQFGEDMKDPVVREQRTLEVLGTDALPEGYYANIGMSIPWVMDFAVISDEPPGEDGDTDDLGEHSFIYFALPSFGTDKDELRDFFAGETDDAQVLSENNINIDLDEMIRRGSLQAGPQEVMYVANRGELQASGSRSEGLVTMVLADCPNDKRTRMGIWATPDPNPEASTVEADFTGSAADEAAIAAFIGHFDLCR